MGNFFPPGIIIILWQRASVRIMKYGKELPHVFRQTFSRASLYLLLKSILHTHAIYNLPCPPGPGSQSSNCYVMCLGPSNMVPYPLWNAIAALSFAIFAAW